MYLLTDVSYKALYINYVGVTQKASIYFPMHLLLLVAKEQKGEVKQKRRGYTSYYIDTGQSIVGTWKISSV